MDFEEGNQKLQEIVKKLEKGDVSLEESTKLYEQGVSIAKDCAKILTDCKGKVTILKDELSQITEGDENNY